MHTLDLQQYLRKIYQVIYWSQVTHFYPDYAKDSVDYLASWCEDLAYYVYDNCHYPTNQKVKDTTTQSIGFNRS